MSIDVSTPSADAAEDPEDLTAGASTGAAASPVDGPDPWHTLDRIGRALHLKEPTLQAALEAVLSTAVEMIDTACAAGLNLYERGRFTPQAVFGAEPPPLDALQQRTGTGPCIDASRDQAVVHVEDLRTDTRYPEFAALALTLGVHAMFCVPLWIDDVRLGSLSLYFTRPEHRRDRDLQVARIIGTHAAAALADAGRSDNLRRAIENRDLIGQAKGILMERHRITADQAFEVLSVASQRVNRKLVVVAESLVMTGALPE